MLQQTQVATVVPYFERFTARFPDLDSLANATEDDVLALWSGLGYYARGRNLHKTARIIKNHHGGQFPDDLETLVKLPGIGRSTGAAILALTWNQRQTILDGNVKRVLARYHRVTGWSGSSTVLRQLWQLAEMHTPEHSCADYTQAIMDLGATVCRRSKPLCEQCPLQSGCLAFRDQCVADYPARKPATDTPRRHRHTHMLVVARSSGEILLEKRPPSGIWGGLWCLPEVTELPTSLEEWGLQRYSLHLESQATLAQVEHRFSHFDLTISPLICHANVDDTGVMDNPEQLWYNPVPAAPVGMAAAVSKIIHAYLQSLEQA